MTQHRAAYLRQSSFLFKQTVITCIVCTVSSSSNKLTDSSYQSSIFNFCRATLCTARPMLLCGGCPSIWLSVTFIYCIETSKHILKLFHHPVATPFQFSIPNVTPIFRRESSLMGASNTAAGGKKNREFRPTSCCISEMIQHRPRPDY